jgi:hypothetical protein
MASIRLCPAAPVFTVLAWAYFTSLMVDSTWGQIDDTLRGETEPYNTCILAFKVGILSATLISLILSFRRVTASGSATHK